MSGNILFFDTETTGFLNASAPAAERNRIVQLGMLLTDKDGQEVDRFDKLVQQSKPIPQDSIKIHGKTDAMCMEQGIPSFEVMNTFKEWCENADILVAHNAGFDIKFMMSEAEIENVDLKLPKRIICTMELYKDIVKIPPTEKMLAAGRTGYKVPKLEEVYRTLFEKDFDNAHDAFADVSATKDIYFEYFIRDMGRHFPGTLKNAQYELTNQTTSDLVMIDDDKFLKGLKPEEILSNDGFNKIVATCNQIIAQYPAPSLNTAKGQKELASFAHRFRKAKKPIKEMCAAYIEELEKPILEQQKKVKSAKDELGRIEGLLEDKYKEVRAPLTQKEADEKAHLASLKNELSRMRAFGSVRVESTEHGAKLLEGLKKYQTIDFEKLQDEANAEYHVIYERISDKIKLLKIEEAAPKISENWGETLQEAPQPSTVQAPIQAAPYQEPAPVDLKPAALINPDQIRQVKEDIYICLAKKRILPNVAEILVEAIINNEIPHVKFLPIYA